MEVMAETFLQEEEVLGLSLVSGEGKQGLDSQVRSPTEVAEEEDISEELAAAEGTAEDIDIALQSDPKEDGVASVGADAVETSGKCSSGCPPDPPQIVLAEPADNPVPECTLQAASQK